MRLWPGVALFCAASGVLLAPASANGRFPATTNVEFSDQEDFFLLPATFGLLLTRDGGETFQWVCEQSIGYGGTYDPDYAINAAGDIYATTFFGLRVSRDGGCSFTTIAGPFMQRWVSEIDIAADQRVWAVTSTGGVVNDVYVADDGETFASVGLASDQVWWLSVRSAPTNPQRVFVSGYSPERPNPGGGPNLPPESLLRRTDNGGDTWTELPVTDFALRPDSEIFIEAVSPTDPNLVFARVYRALDPVGDAIYRSLDGGQTWQNVLEMPSAIRAVLLRADGQTVVVGTDNPCVGDPPTPLKGCVMIATDAAAPAGPTWQRPPAQPRMACLGERSDGTLFSCGANWDPDLFGLGSSTDGQSFAPVMRFGDITGPLSCPQETQQYQECERLQWPSLCSQLDNCAPAPPEEMKKKGGGCASGPVGPLCGLLLLIVAALHSRRRRPLPR